MSHLRAPAGRADRREGGRHGRPAARASTALPEAGIRHQLQRMAVLPPVAVALSGCAAVLFTVRSTGAGPSTALWAVLAGAFSVTVAGVVTAAVAADRAARAIQDRVTALRRATTRGEDELRALVEQLRRGEEPPAARGPRPVPPGDADEFELLAAELDRARDGAVTAVVQAAQLSSQTGSEQKLEVFVNLARRLQSLVHREISLLDELENDIEDPDLLKGLFHVDHLATRIRRHAENLAVLGGAVSRRQWSNPVPMTEVLRSAIAEVEQYSRVRLVPPLEGDLRGHAVADVIHLLAELVENATVFSAPHTQVLFRAGFVTSGLAVEVEDRGLGMPAEERARMNALLADPDQVDVSSLLTDGRIGLYVVSQLARRHGITVRLHANIYGGVQAVLVVPQELLGTPPADQDQSPEGTAQGYAAADATGGLTHYTEPVRHGLSDYLDAQRHGTTGHLPEYAADTSPHGPHDHAGYGDTDAPRHTGPDSADHLPPYGLPEAPAPYDAHDTVTGANVPHVPDLTYLPQQPAAPRRRTGRHASDGDGPPPLPVRGSHDQRPTPADAVPGIRPDDRHLLDEYQGVPPGPRTGVVRGTMGKPHLPRRRSQEHLVPQLRDTPAPRRDHDDTVGHDPGLMAAFQRGIGLAETRHHLDLDDHRRTAAHPDPLREDPVPPTVTIPAARTAPDLLHAHGGRDHATRSDGSGTAG